MRLGAMKYIHPVFYAGTKLFADSIFSCFGGGTPTRLPAHLRHVLELPKPVSLPRPPVSCTYVTPPVRETISVAPRLRPKVAAPSRPAAVKRNGGLRGSTATRWR
jgi:hypothetical protein